MTEPETRCGFVAIIGAPNAGKSTLVNALVGTKVSIVTHKVQTTRFPVRGVMIYEKSQVILVDTPGVFAPKRRLDRAMVRSAWQGAEEADQIVHLVDAAAWYRASHKELARPQDKKAATDVNSIVAELQKLGRKTVLVLNKIDLIEKEFLLEQVAHFNETGIYSDIIMLSATKGSGLDGFKKLIAKTVPAGPWHYPADQAGDVPMRLMAAEITREKLMLRVHEELPYSASVTTESWESKKDGSVVVRQIIFVERESQRKIVLGKNGKVIKAIGQASRHDIMELLGRTVHLFLHIKVANWSQDKERYTEFGLEFE
ncbi:GTP-binding protein Era [hydrothermal vent metagenome]|uniref:GTP-binding protein Era n=1 Tax=hydrothermal vent metagenome TaxID=652676 RepID=A0A3B0RNC5_9ZZZZ